MKTEWDYTELAAAYLKRPDYAREAIRRMIELTGVRPGDPVCDIGAGAAHLTRLLVEHGLAVTAIEPNDAMRANGQARTSGQGVTWIEGTAERTGQAGDAFALVTFGSSFNVTDRPAALAETARLLRRGGWFACMWNHRDIHDPLQKRIEDVIRRYVPEYDYGTRREDQTEVIQASGLFGEVVRVEGGETQRQSVDDCIEAWRSHGTLQRQAQERFSDVVAEIAAVVRSTGLESVEIPYVTRIWAAPVLK